MILTFCSKRFYLFKGLGDGDKPISKVNDIFCYFVVIRTTYCLSAWETLLIKSK
jgi:hypothetical protein